MYSAIRRLGPGFFGHFCLVWAPSRLALRKVKGVGFSSAARLVIMEASLPVTGPEVDDKFTFSSSAPNETVVDSNLARYVVVYFGVV